MSSCEHICQRILLISEPEPELPGDRVTRLIQVTVWQQFGRLARAPLEIW